MPIPPEVDLRRFVTAMGLAAAERDEDRLRELAEGVDAETAGALVSFAVHYWIGMIDLLGETAGEADPRAHTVNVLRNLALSEAAATE
jgi:hypothetical protein